MASEAPVRPVARLEGLFRPTGPSSVSGPQNGSYVWGVDPGSVAVSFAAVGPSWGTATTKFKAGLDVGARLADIHDETVAAAHAFAVDYPPTWVWVEQLALFSRRPAPVLYYATGVIIGALYEALEHVYDHPVTVSEIPPSSWKAEACGNGRIDKAGGKVLAWAKRNGYEGEVLDEADALGIAVAGHGRVFPTQTALAL